jgi:hypothetical protein
MRIISAYRSIRMQARSLTAGIAAVALSFLLSSNSAMSMAFSIAVDPHGGFWQQGNVPSSRTSTTVAELGAPKYDPVNDDGIIISPALIEGYWVVTSGGKIYSRGAAPQLCSNLKTCSGYKGEGIVAASANASGTGFWAVDEKGHVWTVGDAKSFGDATKATTTRIHPVQIASTLTARGYYIFMSDGGVYTFGDAQYFGSGYKKIHAPLIGAALNFDAAGSVIGYWLSDSASKLANSTSILYFGRAVHFSGDLCKEQVGQALHLKRTIASFPYRTGLVAASDDHGYSYCLYPRAQLVSVGSQMAIAPPEIGKTIKQNLPGDRLSQVWDIVAVDGASGTVQIRNVATGLCASADPGSQTVVAKTCEPLVTMSADQLWKLRTVDGSWTFESESAASSFLSSSGPDVDADLKVLPGGSINPKFSQWRSSARSSRGVVSLAEGYASMSGSSGCVISSKSLDGKTKSSSIGGVRSDFSVEITGNKCSIVFVDTNHSSPIHIDLDYLPGESGTFAENCSGCKVNAAPPVVSNSSGQVHLNMPPSDSIFPSDGEKATSLGDQVGAAVREDLL